METIGSISFAMQAAPERRMRIGAIALLWATTVNGVTFPIGEIMDFTDEDLPWYAVYVTDWEGNKYDFADLTTTSQDAIFSCVVNELF